MNPPDSKFDEALAREATAAVPGLPHDEQGPMFREPLTNITVHVESGQLAFLRADFTVVVDGAVRSHGVDYFTLVKDAATWKLLNASYTSTPGAP